MCVLTLNQLLFAVDSDGGDRTVAAESHYDGGKDCRVQAAAPSA